MPRSGSCVIGQASRDRILIILVVTDWKQVRLFTAARLVRQVTLARARSTDICALLRDDGTNLVRNLGHGSLTTHYTALDYVTTGHTASPWK
jgi:hypothetical protein